MNEAAFSACLAWHWTDHHRQCNWWVVCNIDEWYACVRAKKRTHRATIVTIFSHMTRDVLVLSNVTRFLYFWGKLPQIQTSNFRLITFARQCGNTLKVWWEILYWFCWKFTSLWAAKEFCKYIKNWQSYRREFGVLLFWDTGYSLALATLNALGWTWKSI